MLADTHGDLIWSTLKSAQIFDGGACIQASSVNGCRDDDSNIIGFRTTLISIDNVVSVFFWLYLLSVNKHTNEK